MKYRNTSKNIIKIMILALFLSVLFVIPKNTKADDLVETTLYVGKSINNSFKNSGIAANAVSFGPATEEEYQAALNDSSISKYRIGPEVNGEKSIVWLTSDNRGLYHINADIIYLNSDSRMMFKDCVNLETIDLRNFVFDNVTNMSNLFYNCSSLKTILGIENINTSKVTNMDSVFYKCSSLTSIDVSNWDVSNVTDISELFYDCSGLTSIDVSDWDVGSVNNFLGMFGGCSSLTTLDVSDWDVSNATSIQTMFNGCSNLEYIDLTKWDVSNVSSASFLFKDCTKLTSIDLSSWDTSNMSATSYMFQNCVSLTTLNLSNFNTSKVVYFDSMFEGCSNLTNLNLKNMKVYNAKYMRKMFKNCSSLEELDLSNFDTSKVTDMSNMFEGMTNLKELDIRNFDTSSATTMSQAFFDIPNLERVYVSELFSTDNISSGQILFRNNTKLVGEKGTAFDLNNVNKTYARIDDPENGNPGYFTYGEYKPKIYYPDGTFEEVELGYLFTFPDSYQKDDEVAATVNFHYHDGVTPSKTSTVMKQSTFNNWKVNDDTYEPGDTLTINIDTYLEAEYTEVLTGAEFPEDPTLENNTFLGWFDKKNGGNQYTSYNEEKDIDLYAQWESTIIDDNLNIENISVTGGSLDPSFDNDREFYSLRLNDDFKEEDKLIINVQPESVFTTVVGNGQIDISQNTFTVTLTSEAGNTRVVSFDLIQNIRIEKDNYNLDEGETENIVVTYPSDTSELNVSVENKDIADINNFVITAIETGRTTARISLKNDDSIYRDIIISVDGNELKSYIYEISGEENKQILGANPRTKVIDFKNNLQNDNDQLKIYDNDTLLTDNDLIKTGSTVKLVINDEEKDMATIIVKGDINKDGKVNIKDESLLFDDAKVGKKLTDYEKIAADLDNNDLVDETDLTKIHDYILYRNRKLNLRKLTIDPKGGTINGNSNIQTITQSQDTITLDNPEKEGYTFDEWKLSGSGSIDGKIYTFGEGNGTLKANYKAPKEITLFDSNGSNSFTLNNRTLELQIGSTLSMNVELDTNERIEYSYSYGNGANGSVTIYDGAEEVFEKSHTGSGKDSFENTGVKKTYKVVFSSSSAVHNVEILTKNNAKAALTTNNVVVEYQPYEGSLTGNTKDIKTIGLTYGSLPTPQKKGYSFDGWYLNPDLTGIVTESTIVTNTNNHTLYAKYTINSYTLSINSNGGTYPWSTSVTQKYLSTTTVTRPSRSNYLFDGWSVSGAGSITDNASTNQIYTYGAGNGTITANWISKNKSVSISNSSYALISEPDGTIKVAANNMNYRHKVTLTLKPGESIEYKLYRINSIHTAQFRVDDSIYTNGSTAGALTEKTYVNESGYDVAIELRVQAGIDVEEGEEPYVQIVKVTTKYGETYNLTH